MEKCSEVEPSPDLVLCFVRTGEGLRRISARDLVLGAPHCPRFLLYGEARYARRRFSTPGSGVRQRSRACRENSGRRQSVVRTPGGAWAMARNGGARNRIFSLAAAGRESD